MIPILKWTGLAGLLVAGGALAAGIDVGTPEDGRLGQIEAGTEWRTTVGGGAAYVPEYQGADKSEWRAIPLIDASKGRLFVSTLRGIGANLSSRPGIEFGPRLTYRGGRDESDSARLRGLGDIDAAPEIGAYVQMRYMPATPVNRYAPSTRGAL